MRPAQDADFNLFVEVPVHVLPHPRDVQWPKYRLLAFHERELALSWVVPPGRLDSSPGGAPRSALGRSYLPGPAGQLLH